MIDSKISDRDDREEVMNKVMEYVCETDDIHTEVGLQCGFVIAMQAVENVLKEIKDNKFRIRKE